MPTSEHNINENKDESPVYFKSAKDAIDKIVELYKTTKPGQLAELVDKFTEWEIKEKKYNRSLKLKIENNQLF